jgi:thiol:disulfide interchange protein
MLRFLIAALAYLGGLSAQGAHTQARLPLAAETARPGDTVMAGVRLQMDPRWHIYWRNPGASGMATAIEWQLPPGITAGAIQWPLPEKLPDQDLTTYIYKDEVVLLVPLKLAPELPPGPLELKAKVSWLECDQQCIPGRAAVAATLNIGADAKPSKDAALLANWQKKLPQTGGSLSARAWWEKTADGNMRPLLLEWNSARDAAEADFYPDASEQFEVQPATERIPAESGRISLRKQVKKFSGDWPARVSGVLVQQSGAERLGYEVSLPIQSSVSTAATKPGSGAADISAIAAAPLWQMLVYAFLGGLILNVMPCVLPVIALKILGFVGQAKDQPRRVRTLGLIYGLGVVISFLALAGLVIGVKAAGHNAAWGMQFANPQFLVVLTVLVTLVALNLFGLFEVNLSGQVLGAAGGLTSKHGAAGAFFNGVLATALATPCTAPFLGAALGFAFARSTGIILLFFLTIGVGLAAPYVILSWEPAWLKFLPRPGPWMQRFKVAMGFPMLAAAIWIFSLVPLYYGKRTLWLGLFLVAVALAAWVYGEFVQRGRARRWLGVAATAALLAGGYAYAIEGQLRWRSPLTESETAGSLKESPDGIDWQRWDPAAVARARAEGRPVLVDFTADWCLTCQANKRLAIDIPSVRRKLKEINALPLLGDYTRQPDNITAELNRFGRAGVPLVLVYPRKPEESPIVLPEALTPGIVSGALERAAQ